MHSEITQAMFYKYVPRYISGTVSLSWLCERLPRLVGQRNQSCPRTVCSRLINRNSWWASVPILSNQLGFLAKRRQSTIISIDAFFSMMSMYQVCIQEPESNESVFSRIAEIIFEDSHARTVFSTQTIAVVKFCQILQCDNSTVTMLNHLCQMRRSTHSSVPVTFAITEHALGKVII